MTQQKWIEETTDPTTGEKLLFIAASESDLDRQLADWFGDDLATGDEMASDTANPGNQ